VDSASFSPADIDVVTGSWDGTARSWDVHFETMSTPDLIREACKRLGGISTLTRDQMRLAGYADSEPLVNVCKDAK
jgi:hypothetical protein